MMLEQGLSLGDAVRITTAFIGEHQGHTGFEEPERWVDDTLNLFIRCNECQRTQIVRVHPEAYREAMEGETANFYG